MKTIKLPRASRNARGTYSSNAERWEAVSTRNPDADGKFYYSVRTTGVYCRPCCGARAALRENVQFHNSCEAAELAGFRPCKRCRPKGHTIAQRDISIVAAACRAIQNAEEAPGLDLLAKEAGLSRFHFHRVFRKVAGVTPKVYALAHRAERMRKALRKRKSVTEAIYDAGFNSNSRFYTNSSEMLGMLPKNYRDGGDRSTIRFAVGECSLGSILVATSDKGVCAIFFGDEANALIRELQDRFPKARILPGDKRFQKLVAQVVGFVEEPETALQLPIDIRGTAFQRKVWTALRQIPAGTTASYSYIAKKIGHPEAVRAVAGACAANPIAVAIPCHRVVRSDGALSGYRWGVERKRALLSRETHRQGTSHR